MIDATKLATDLGDRGTEWAITQAAFRALEDTEKSVLAEHTQLFLNQGAKSHAVAESKARACPEFVDFLCISIYSNGFGCNSYAISWPILSHAYF